MDEDDPFHALQDWAKDAEQRVRRERRRSGLRRKLAILAPFAVLALLLVALVPIVRPWLADATGGSSASAKATESAEAKESVPDGISVTTSVSAAPSGPFAGSPAATYPKGEAGISLPPAKAVPGFTAAQVSAALRKVRAALIAGRLDETMLIRHDPARFLALLAPNERGHIRARFTKRDFQGVATWIDPASTLDGREQPRVSGRVTYTSAWVQGMQTLQITTNFVWVYAFAHVAKPLAAEHDQTRWEFPTAENLRPGDRGMWIADSKSYSALVDCAAARTGLLAPDQVGAVAPDPQNSEDPKAYLRADHSLDIGDDCHLSPSAAPTH
jgi:hypothetical protein